MINMLHLAEQIEIRIGNVAANARSYRNKASQKIRESMGIPTIEGISLRHVLPIVAKSCLCAVSTRLIYRLA